MIKRIELILKTQNLTPSQFADKIGVQRSGLSHVLSGRNNPSLDFVTKVLTAFPQVDAVWLLTGKGKMYANMTEEKIGEIATEIQAEIPPEPIHPKESDLFSEPVFEAEKNMKEESLPPLLSITTPAPEENPQPLLPPSKNNLELDKIVFFYSDGTFLEYRPA